MFNLSYHLFNAYIYDANCISNILLLNLDGENINWSIKCKVSQSVASVYLPFNKLKFIQGTSNYVKY